MTSLIFGSIYLGHHAFTEHRREKQRVKNYERWEGLRDEYDEQRKIGRESRSLDLQRTGTGSWDGEEQNNRSRNGYGYGEHDRPILTLRDQQEANDARTSWRPQESWDEPRTQLQAQMTGRPQQPYPHAQRHISTPAAPTMQDQYTGNVSGGSGTGGGTSFLPLRSQKTGATWDEGLPQPLRVSRQDFGEYDHRAALMCARGRTASAPGVGRNPTPSVLSDARRGSTLRESTNAMDPTRTSPSRSPPLSQQQHAPIAEVQSFNFPSRPAGVEVQKQPFFDIEPVESHVPGGPMAELIERGY